MKIIHPVRITRGVSNKFYFSDRENKFYWREYKQKTNDSHITTAWKRKKNEVAELKKQTATSINFNRQNKRSNSSYKILLNEKKKEDKTKRRTENEMKCTRKRPYRRLSKWIEKKNWNGVTKRTIKFYLRGSTSAYKSRHLIPKMARARETVAEGWWLNKRICSFAFTQH